MKYKLPEFDALLRLSIDDASVLDQIKKEATQALVSGAPEKYHKRLNGLQFQIDMELRRSKSPLDGCIRISKMMHESMGELNQNLQEVVGPRSLSRSNTFRKSAQLQAVVEIETETVTSADILPFRNCS